MTRRRGITLLETLAAIFITGIGLLSLLTLFPAGAVKMAEAVKDDRTGHIKESGHSLADVLGVRGHTFNRVTGAPLTDDQNNDPVIEKMLRPGGGLPNLFDPATNSYPNALLPSYPVFVDPNGYYANASDPNGWQSWVAGANNPGILARTVPAPLHPAPNINPDQRFIADPVYRTKQRIASTVFLDDMRFQRESDNDNPNGPVYTGWPVRQPSTPTVNERVDRTPRWSWAWMVQRPRVNIPQVVELTVVVYNGRDLSTPRTGEQVFDGTFNTSGTVRITWQAGQQPPELKIGGWVLDVRTSPMPRAKFHRVTNITQIDATNMDVEIQGAVQSGTGKVLILENVVEVFERGTL